MKKSNEIEINGSNYKALHVIVSCAIDFKPEYMHYENMTVEKAMKLFFKKHKDAIVYDVKITYP